MLSLAVNSVAAYRCTAPLNESLVDTRIDEDPPCTKELPGVGSDIDELATSQLFFDAARVKVVVA